MTLPMPLSRRAWPQTPGVSFSAWDCSTWMGSRTQAEKSRPSRPGICPGALKHLCRYWPRAWKGSCAAEGGFDTLGLLREAAGKLARTTNLWACVIPGLLPVEIAAIVHWARVEPQRAIDLVDNIESWRDVPMHKAGGPPDPSVPMEVHVERHVESVYEFYSGATLACRANTLIVRGGTYACEAPCLVRAFQGARPGRGGVLSRPNIKMN